MERAGGDGTISYFGPKATVEKDLAPIGISIWRHTAKGRNEKLIVVNSALIPKALSTLAKKKIKMKLKHLL